MPARSARTLTLVVVSAVAAACSGGLSSPVPDDSPRPSVAPTQIGPAGGTVRVGDVELTVPAGAVTSDVVLTVSKSGAAPEGLATRGAVYTFGPDGLRFAKPVTVSLPAEGDGGSVWWTMEGSRDAWERLPTRVEEQRAYAEVSHFSAGVVGTPVGVTCTVKRRVAANGTCTQSVQTEKDVDFALTAVGGDPIGGLTTSSTGIRSLYNSGPQPYFHAIDAAHVTYRGSSSPDPGTGTRHGTLLTFALAAQRGGMPDKLCPSTPVIDVACAGTTELKGNVSFLPPVPPDPEPYDAGSAPIDAGPAPGDAGATDASPAQDSGPPIDAGSPPQDAGSGVRCEYGRVVSDAASPTGCRENVTIDENVSFTVTAYAGDPKKSLYSNFVGITGYYNNATPQFVATDATYATYLGANGPPSGLAVRTGDRIDFTMNAQRGSINNAGCQYGYLHRIVCSGSTTLKNWVP